MTVVFVGGSARSGTTLLQSVLCSTPATNPPVHEDTTIRHLAQSYEDVGRHFKRHNRFIYRDLDDAAAFHRELLRAYLRQLRKAWPDARHLVIKHPMLTGHFPTLAHLLPRARFVISVRDPRGIIASLMAVTARDPSRFPAGAAERDLSVFLGRFNYHYQAALRHFTRQDQKRCLWQRYEDLVADPRKCAALLGRFTGIDLSGYDPEQPWRGWHDGLIDLEERSSSPYYAPLWGNAVSDERIDAWRDELTAAEAAGIAEHTSRFMKIFRYDAPDPA